MAVIIMVMAERETVVTVMANVQTKSVHTRGSQTLHVASLEAHSKGPLTPGAIPPRHAGHGEGWEGNLEKACAHLLRLEFAALFSGLAQIPPPCHSGGLQLPAPGLSDHSLLMGPHHSCCVARPHGTILLSLGWT